MSRRRNGCPLGVAAGIALLAVSPGAATAQLSESCPHVRLLGPEDEAEVNWSEEDNIVPAQRNQRRVVQEALALLPPFLCTAVQRVVFVDDTERPGVTGWSKANDRQDLLYLNVASGIYREGNLSIPGVWAEAVHTILHEATHIGVRLLYARSEASPPAWLEFRPEAALWRPAALQAADEVITKLRLEKGFLQEWEWIHESFRHAGWAGEYYGDDWKEHANEDHPANGFTSAYGGENMMEDIAEMTAWPLSAPGFNGVPQTSPEDFACQKMRKEPGPSIPSGLAAVFAKVGFLHSAGFIDDQAYADCVGKLKIRGSGSGFFSYRDRELERSYTGNVERKIGLGSEMGAGEEGEPYLFVLSAEGTASTTGEPNVPVRVELVLSVAPNSAELAEASYPRGIHWVGFRHNKYDRLHIFRRDDGRKIVDVTDGVVLVSRASRDLIEGSVFVNRYFNFSTSLSAIAGDEPPKKPTSITFRFEN